MREHSGNILLIPKKVRELYAVSLTAMSLQSIEGSDWWVHIPANDPPDGLVMTLTPEGEGLKGYLREVEVVEHRDRGELLFETIHKKMTEKAYSVDTVLVCLAVTTGMYDFKRLAKRLKPIESNVTHVFVLFAGASIADLDAIPEEELKTNYAMIQLLPSFIPSTFNLRPFLDDFEKKYEMGRESRLIEEDAVYFGTANPKHATP